MFAKHTVDPYAEEMAFLLSWVSPPGHNVESLDLFQAYLNLATATPPGLGVPATVRVCEPHITHWRVGTADRARIDHGLYVSTRTSHPLPGRQQVFNNGSRDGPGSKLNT